MSPTKKFLLTMPLVVLLGLSVVLMVLRAEHPSKAVPGTGFTSMGINYKLGGPVVMGGQVHGTTATATFSLTGDCDSTATDGGASMHCTHYSGDAGSIPFAALPACDAGEVPMGPAGSGGGTLACSMPATIPSSYAMNGQVHGTTAAASFTVTGDCPSIAVDGGVNVKCTTISGTDAGTVGNGVNVSAAKVTNVNTVTEELGPITTIHTTGTMTWALPLATGGWFDVLTVGRVPGDAGTYFDGLTGGAKWSCGVTSYNTNTCKAFSACTASSAWAANADAGSATTVSVAVAAGGAGCTGTITVNSGGQTMDWVAVVQYVSVQ